MFDVPSLFPSKPALGRLAPQPARNAEVGQRPAEPSGSQGQLRIRCGSGDGVAVVDAQLVGLTRNGLMAIVDGAVRGGQTVWIRLEGATTFEDVEATVLGSNWLRRGRCALRLALAESYPDGFYEALIGCLSRQARPDPRPAPMGLRRRPGTPGA